jgi:hypothetical protein
MYTTKIISIFAFLYVINTYTATPPRFHHLPGNPMEVETWTDNKISRKNDKVLVKIHLETKTENINTNANFEVPNDITLENFEKLAQEKTYNKNIRLHLLMCRGDYHTRAYPITTQGANIPLLKAIIYHNKNQFEPIDLTARFALKETSNLTIPNN